MTDSPCARFTQGRIEFADAASFQSGMDRLLLHGTVIAAGEGFPPPLRESEIAVRFPDGRDVWMTGQVISLKDGRAILELLNGGDVLFSELLSLRFPQVKQERRQYPRLEKTLPAQIEQKAC